MKHSMLRVESVLSLVLNNADRKRLFQSMYSYAVRHWAKPADPHVINHAGLTPLTLATKLGRKQIFEEMLELMKVVSTVCFLLIEF